MMVIRTGVGVVACLFRAKSMAPGRPLAYTVIAGRPLACTIIAAVVWRGGASVGRLGVGETREGMGMPAGRRRYCRLRRFRWAFSFWARHERSRD